MVGDLPEIIGHGRGMVIADVIGTKMESRIDPGCTKAGLSKIIGMNPIAPGGFGRINDRQTRSYAGFGKPAVPVDSRYPECEDLRACRCGISLKQ
jgi:hypothetical protein